MKEIQIWKECLMKKIHDRDTHKDRFESQCECIWKLLSEAQNVKQ